MNTHRNRTRARLMRGWRREFDGKCEPWRVLYLAQLLVSMVQLHSYTSKRRRKFYWRNPVGCTQPNFKACLRGCVGVCEAGEGDT